MQAIQEKYIPLIMSKQSIINYLVFLFGLFCFSASASTSVGGIISSDTIWDAAHSPYILTSDIEIAPNVALTVEPGTIVKTIDRFTNRAIMVWGSFRATGSSFSRVTLDNISVNSGTSSVSIPSIIYLDNVDIMSGYVFSQTTGHAGGGILTLKNSRLQHTAPIELYNTAGPSLIEGNLFSQTGGIVARQENAVSIIKNTFSESLGNYSDQFAIMIISSSNPQKITIQKNYFSSTDRAAIRFTGGSPANIDAMNNFWNTTDASIIEGMIFDRGDTLNAPGYVVYEPTLSSPDAQAASLSWWSWPLPTIYTTPHLTAVKGKTITLNNLYGLFLPDDMYEWLIAPFSDTEMPADGVVLAQIDPPDQASFKSRAELTWTAPLTPASRNYQVSILLKNISLNETLQPALFSINILRDLKPKHNTLKIDLTDPVTKISITKARYDIASKKLFVKGKMYISDEAYYIPSNVYASIFDSSGLQIDNAYLSGADGDSWYSCSDVKSPPKKVGAEHNGLLAVKAVSKTRRSAYPCN